MAGNDESMIEQWVVEGVKCKKVYPPDSNMTMEMMNISKPAPTNGSVHR